MPFFGVFFRWLAGLFLCVGTFSASVCLAGGGGRFGSWYYRTAGEPVARDRGERPDSRGGGGGNTADGGDGMATMNGGQTRALRSAVKADHVDISGGEGRSA